MLFLSLSKIKKMIFPFDPKFWCETTLAVLGNRRTVGLVIKLRPFSTLPYHAYPGTIFTHPPFRRTL